MRPWAKRIGIGGGLAVVSAALVLTKCKHNYADGEVGGVNISWATESFFNIFPSFDVVTNDDVNSMNDEYRSQFSSHRVWLSYDGDPDNLDSKYGKPLGKMAGKDIYYIESEKFLPFRGYIMLNYGDQRGNKTGGELVTCFYKLDSFGSRPVASLDRLSAKERESLAKWADEVVSELNERARIEGPEAADGKANSNISPAADSAQQKSPSIGLITSDEIDLINKEHNSGVILFPEVDSFSSHPSAIALRSVAGKKLYYFPGDPADSSSTPSVWMLYGSTSSKGEKGHGLIACCRKLGKSREMSDPGIINLSNAEVTFTKDEWVDILGWAEKTVAALDKVASIGEHKEGLARGR